MTDDSSLVYFHFFFCEGYQDMKKPVYVFEAIAVSTFMHVYVQLLVSGGVSAYSERLFL